MKKCKYFFYSVVLTFILTGCGGSISATMEAKSYSTKYHREFQEKVIEDFGKTAKLKGVQGEINESRDSLWSLPHYYASGRLKGRIILNDKEYDSIYDPLSKNLYTNINYESIIQSILRLLPISEENILSVDMSDNSGKKSLFTGEVNDIQQALLTDKVNITILTTEDIGAYDYEDYDDLSILCNKPYNIFEMKIICKTAIDNSSTPLEVNICPKIDGGYSIIRNSP